MLKADSQMLTKKASLNKYRHLVKKKKAKTRSRRFVYFLLVVLVIAAFIGGWRLWLAIYGSTPRFNFIMVSVNSGRQKILSGESLSFHPNDKVKILNISTNIFLNLGTRLVADNFDVSALRYEEMPLSSLLPNRDILNNYKFRIKIKHNTRDLGFIIWSVHPITDDWLDKANRIINKKQRVAILERAQHSMPEDKRIRQRLLDEYKAQRLWKQAAIILEEMVKKNPERSTVSDLLDVYTAMHNKDGIISVLKMLVKLAPNDTKGRTRLAEALEEKGKIKAAINEYEILLKQVPKKNRLPIYKRLGYLFSKTGEPKKAISFYLKAVDLDKKDSNLYYNLSGLYEKIKKKEKADLYLTKAVSLKSGDVKSRLKLARRLIKRGRVKEAKRHLTEVLKKKPKSINALLLMARIAEKQGEKKNLKKIYKKILLLDSKNETVIYNLAVLEYETGDLDTGLHYFEKYVKLHPKDETVHGILFDIYKKKNNTEKAFKEAQILIGLRPKEADPYIYVFNYLNVRGDYKKIIPVMQKAIKANPKNITLREYLLVAYIKTGKEVLVIKQMKEILKVRPKDVGLLLHLARLFEKRGNYGEALGAYRRIVEISPNNEEAEEAYLRLRLKGVQVEGSRQKALP